MASNRSFSLSRHAWKSGRALRLRYGKCRRLCKEVSKLAPEHLRDATTPFEVIYALAFLFSVGHAAGIISGTIRSGAGSIDEYGLLLSIIATAVLFQFLRIYYYLHGFDHIRLERHAKPEIKGVDGLTYLNDRLLRLLLSGVIVVSAKYTVDLSDVQQAVRPALLRAFQVATIEISAPDINPQLALLAIRFSVSIIISFLLLMLWDVNIHLHFVTCRNELRKNSSIWNAANLFYYIDPSKYDSSFLSMRQYFLGLKFLERITGLLFGVAATAAFMVKSYALAAGVMMLLVLFITIFKQGQSRQNVRPLAKTIAYVWSPVSSLISYVAIYWR